MKQHDERCPLCGCHTQRLLNERRVVKRRGHRRLTVEPASRNLEGGWRETPCPVCVMKSFDFDQLMYAMQLAFAEPDDKDPRLMRLPQVKISFNYRRPRKVRRSFANRIH